MGVNKSMHTEVKRPFCPPRDPNQAAGQPATPAGVSGKGADASAPASRVHVICAVSSFRFYHEVLSELIFICSTLFNHVQPVWSMLLASEYLGVRFVFSKRKRRCKKATCQLSPFQPITPTYTTYVRQTSGISWAPNPLLTRRLACHNCLGTENISLSCPSATWCGHFVVRSLRAGHFVR